MELLSIDINCYTLLWFELAWINMNPYELILITMNSLECLAIIREDKTQHELQWSVMAYDKLHWFVNNWYDLLGVPIISTTY